MAAMLPISSNFYTNSFETFQQEVRARLGNNNILVKSYEVFNRCIAQTSRLMTHRSNGNLSFVNLPEDNRALQQLLLAEGDRVIPNQAGGEGAEGSQVTEAQVTEKILALPAESQQRQQLVESVMSSPEMQSYLAENPQERDRVTASLAPRGNVAVSEEELVNRESSLVSMIFALPLESAMLQNSLAAFRASYEQEIPNRFKKVLDICEKLFTPDPAEYPGGDNPIEHKATIVYADRTRLDQLMTITYQRTFGDQASAAESAKSLAEKG